MADKKFTVTKTELLKHLDVPKMMGDFLFTLAADKLKSETKKNGNGFLYTTKAVDILDEYTYQETMTIEQIFKGFELDDKEIAEALQPGKLKQFKEATPSFKRCAKNLLLSTVKFDELSEKIATYKEIIDGMAPKVVKSTKKVSKDGTLDVADKPFDAQLIKEVPVKSEPQKETEPVEPPIENEAALAPSEEPKEEPKPKRSRKPKESPAKKMILEKLADCSYDETIDPRLCRELILDNKLMTLDELARATDAQIVCKLKIDYLRLSVDGKLVLINKQWVIDHIDELAELLIPTDIGYPNIMDFVNP